MYRYYYRVGFAISLVLLCGIASNIWAETGGFKISDYIPERFEDFEWRVDGSFRMSGNDTENDIDANQLSPYKPNQKINKTVNNHDYNYSLRSNIAYDYITIQKFFNIHISLDGNTKFGNSDTKEIGQIFNRLETETSYLSTQAYNLNFYNSLDAGRYISKDFFLSAKSYFSYYYNEVPKYQDEYFHKYEYDEDPEFIIRQDWENSSERIDARNINVDGQVMIGWGRQYEGYYASTALYMIEELKDNGLLLEAPSKENMIMLSEIIYQNKLKHYIDKRLHKIESLKEIISFLKSEDIINGSGPNDYLLIQDVWDYFPRNDRRFGSQVRIGIGMNYDYYSHHSSSTRNNRSYDYLYDTNNPDIIDTLSVWFSEDFRYYSRKNDFHGTYLIINAEHSLPLNHKWQLTFTTENKFFLRAENKENHYSISNSYGYSPIISNEDMSYDDFYQLRFISDIDYIVSSRTSFNFLGSYTYNNRVIDVDMTSVLGVMETINTYRINESSWDLYFRVDLNYRITIPTTLNL